MTDIKHEAKKPRYSYRFWRGLYFVFSTFFVLLAVGFSFFSVLSFRSGRIPWAESLMVVVLSLLALTQWRRFRNPPRDPIFERE
jgi:hypothetical protein